MSVALLPDYATEIISNIYIFYVFATTVSWSTGAMDSASDFGSEGCRFESYVDRLFGIFPHFFLSLFFFNKKKSKKENRKRIKMWSGTSPSTNIIGSFSLTLCL
jgi:hypothetical protein